MNLIVKKDGTLLDYLYNNLDIPKKKIKQYLTHGSIYVNNNKVTQFDYKLVCGMKIVIDTEKKKKSILPFEILFEDEHLITVNKPSGLLTIATSKEKERTLYHIVREYLVSKNRNSKVFIVHRLDKDTSGIVVFAKDERTKKILQENWNEYVSIREYVAVVHGKLKKSSGRIVQRLSETKTNLVYVSKKEDAKEAITSYKVIKENEKYSLVSINIDTGRKNQIRVAFSSLGNPIVGDKKYGSNVDSLKRMALHAYKLEFNDPRNNKRTNIEIDLPYAFSKLVK